MTRSAVPGRRAPAGRGARPPGPTGAGRTLLGRDALDDLLAESRPQPDRLVGEDALGDLLAGLPPGPAPLRDDGSVVAPPPVVEAMSPPRRSGDTSTTAQDVPADVDDVDDEPLRARGTSSRSRGRDGGWGRRPARGAGAHGESLDVPGTSADDGGDPEAMARSLCLRALTGAPKTRQQLADLLARREVPEHAAEAVLDRFVEVGLIDDAAFARAWVSSRQAGRGLARRALRNELRAKGVDAEVAAEAVEVVDDEDERTAALRLVERRLPSMRRFDRATATRRLIGMLARKGYNGGLSAAVVRDALDAADLTADAAGGPADDVWEDDLP